MTAIFDDVAVIGAGVSGAMAAHRLAQRGLRVRVLEESRSSGGLLEAIERPGYRVERFYHHLFEHDVDALRVLGELGLERALRWGEVTTGYFVGGRWYDLSGPAGLARFPVLSVPDRLRLALRLRRIRASNDSDVEGLEGMSVREWIGASDDSGLGRLVDGLCRSKFGLDADRVSAAFLAGRLRARVRGRSAWRRRERLASLDGGLGRLPEALLSRAEANGGAVELGTRVRSINRIEGGFTLSAADGRGFAARRIAAAIPPHRLARVATFLTPAERQALERVEHTGVICLCCGLDRPATPCYWGMVGDEQMPFSLLVGHTRLVRESEYGGEHLVYAARYGDAERGAAADGDRTAQEMLDAIVRIANHGPPPKVLWHELSVQPDATPIYGTGFAEAVDGMPRVEGVWLTGATFTYPDSRNVNSMIAAAERVAGDIARAAEEDPWNRSQ